MTQQAKKLFDILTIEKHSNIFDYVCNNYYLLSKEELKDLLKEAIALLYEKAEKENIERGKGYDNFKDLHAEYLKTLQDNTTFFED